MQFLNFKTNPRSGAVRSAGRGSVDGQDRVNESLPRRLTVLPRLEMHWRGDTAGGERMLLQPVSIFRQL